MNRKPLLKKTLELLAKLFGPPVGRVRLSREVYYDYHSGRVSGHRPLLPKKA